MRFTFLVCVVKVFIEDGRVERLKVASAGADRYIEAAFRIGKVFFIFFVVDVAELLSCCALQRQGEQQQEGDGTHLSKLFQFVRILKLWPDFTQTFDRMGTRECGAWRRGNGGFGVGD